MSLFPIISPAAAAAVGTIAFTAAAESGATTGVTSFTFSGHNIGTASSDRLVIVITGNRAETASSTICSGVTIAGDAMTKIVEQQSSVTYESVSIWSRLVASGTTADIIPTFNTNVSAIGIGVFETTGLNTTVSDTGVSTAGPLTSPITIPALGICVGIAGNLNNAATFNWTNLTERFDLSVTGGVALGGASDAFATAQTELDITATASTYNRAAFCIAAWGPA